MNYNEMNNNYVELTGKVIALPKFSHEVFGEGFYDATLEVKRLSEQVDEIPITISERLIEDREMELGDEISIIGQFRSYNKIIGDRSKLMLTVFVRDFIDSGEDINPNQIEITGYVCKEPIYRTTPFKREICDVLLAVNRAYNKSDYIPCITWGRNARYVRNLEVGTKIAIVGRVQSRIYQKTTEDGVIEDRIAYEVSVSKITKLSEVESNNEVDREFKYN